MECCTFLFIYLLVHTSIQQVRRENANDAGTARRRGAGGQGREPRRNALASDRLDRRCWCLRLSCPSSSRSPSWWTCSPLAFAPPVPRSVCWGPSVRRRQAARGEALGQFENFPWAEFLRFMEVLVGFESTLVLSRFSRKAKMLRLNVDPPGSTLLLMLFVEQCLRMELQILKFWLFLMLFCDT